MSGRWRLQVWIAPLVAACGGVWLGAQVPAPASPGGGPAAGLDRAAQVEFLRTARVTRSQTLSTGVTSPFRLTLTDGTVTHDASFQSVNERAVQANFGARGVEFNFARLASLQPGGLPDCRHARARRHDAGDRAPHLER